LSSRLSEISGARFVADSPLGGTGFEPSVPLLRKISWLLPKGDAGPISGCPSAKPITIDGIATSDFTVVVRMAKQRQEDRFYIVPTIVARGEISKRQTAHKQRGRKDMGMWRLSFKDRKDGREAAGTGIEKKMGTV
jgi:hypothetical protein